jgi:hypothetical protein
MDELLASLLCQHTGDGRWAKIHAAYRSASGEGKSIGWLKKRAVKIKKLTDEVNSPSASTHCFNQEMDRPIGPNERLYSLVAQIRSDLRDSEVHDLMTSNPNDTNIILIKIFGELTGLTGTDSMRAWIKYSDAIFGYQDAVLLQDFVDFYMDTPVIYGMSFVLPELDVSQILNLLKTGRKSICGELKSYQGVIRNGLSKTGTLLVQESLNGSRAIAMISPTIVGGVKGNWMSRLFLSSEMNNGGLDPIERIYGQWLEKVYDQLLEANRNMGDLKTECEEWETRMHRVLKLGPAAIVVKTTGGSRDITEFSRSFSNMAIPADGLIITDRRLLMLLIFGIFAFRSVLGALDSIDTQKEAAADLVKESPTKIDSADVAMNTTKTCSACGIQPKKPSRCSKCMSAFYCNRKCQLNHWKEHKKVCSILSGEKHPMGDIFSLRVPAVHKD